MTPPGKGWNEANLSELPAVEQLRQLGYTFVPPDAIEAERDSFREVVLAKRLSAALKKLNPWLSDDNVHKAIRAVANVPATSLIEASEKLHTILTRGISLEQDRGDGKKSHTVRFFDFEKPERNELVVTQQFKVQGSKKNIRPDIVLFVNGIPLVVIECKSPTLGEGWKAEAIDQFSRYQELEERYRDLGAPKLFEPAQILVATCGQAAAYGTVTTPHRFYAEWKRPWPKSDDELERELCRAPLPQDVLFAGMLAPERLLDLVQNFIVFERDADTGKIVRKLCRYQQYIAVNKAVRRARTAKKAEERGGVVWHTQGSGKSLTMLWLALKLRRDVAHENPTIVIVTDRTDLDDQIQKTLIACGFPNPLRAESVRDLRHHLSGPTGITVMTTVQKFQELASTDTKKHDEHPTLSEAANIFVLTDEAHRTQYGSLAANMRKALPNAAFFGFTGTPIDKKDRSTLETFGPYIDTYTIEQAVADGATVPIFYEGRLPELRIIGNTLDAVFDRVFADRSDEEREAIKAKYATEAAIAGAPKRVEAICLDIIDHFTKFIRPNGFKAQIVTVSREVAALYKETLDRLNAPPSAILISGSNKDDDRLERHHTTDDERRTLKERFIKHNDPLSILVVCDMLITGFDAPVEQVMYLDSPLKEHTLLQAIARVNRPADGKTYGLVIDYWGVSEALQEALAIFVPSDVQGALTPKEDELPRLQSRHAAALRFFVRIKDRDNLEACVAVLEPEDVRAEFDAAFRKFSQSLDMMLPDPKALPYVRDARWLGKIRGAAAAKYRDNKLDISDCGAKVRKLIEEAIAADGIQILVKQVSLFTPEFEDKLAALKSDEAKASEMEHAIKHEIHVKIDENPAFYSSLRERLQQIIEDRKAMRIDAAQALLRYETLTKEMRGHGEAAEKLGLSETGFAIFGLLRGPEPVLKVADSKRHVSADDPKVELASLIEEQLAKHVAIVDWQHKEDVQKDMRRDVKRQLKAANYSKDKIDALAESVVELMKRRRR
ncbi:MAG: type I restriction endonuclease subunit R [Sorangiineae bacterium PRO1]|nr:type I restriction endonuclease subunit R [Sorangiineae bacterium PRO1]